MITMTTDQLEQEILRLKSQLSLKDEQLALKEAQIDHRDEQPERKNERILYLERQLFGRRSEKRLPDYSSGQLSLFDEMQGRVSLEPESGLSSLIEDITKGAVQRREQKQDKAAVQKRSYKIPLPIERRETVVNPENADLNTMIKIGEDVSERLMLDPSKFRVERIIRPIYKEKYSRSALSAKIIQAPAKPAILPGCIASGSVLSRIVIDKFLYPIPEYRQSVRFKEFWIEITTSGINRWVHAIADKPYPLYIVRMNAVLASDYIHLSSTQLITKINIRF